jgi:hypothetical protein
MATRDGRYRGYRRIVALYPLILLGYFGVAWSDWWLPRHVSNEVFPFFSWDLFSSARQDGRLYTIRVTVVDERAPAAGMVGELLSDPRTVRFLRDPRFQKTARSLARAHWQKREHEVKRLAVQLGNFLRPEGIVEYDLMYLSYHPLRYYRGEEIPKETQIARFRVAGP